MKIIPENTEDIAAIIAHEFRSFGGGRPADGNPIAAAAQEGPAIFALGVNIEDVVSRVIKLHAIVGKEAASA